MNPKRIFCTIKNIPSQDEWIVQGKPDILIKVKKLPNCTVYDEVGYGNVVIIMNNGRVIRERDMVKVGRLLVLGNYYTGGKTEIYWKHQG